MDSNNSQTLDGLAGSNWDPIVVPAVFNCDTAHEQEQEQEHEDSIKIAAVDPAGCMTTGHEQSQVNLHHPVPQYGMNYFPPLGQTFYVCVPGGYVASYMVFNNGLFQTGLYGRK